MVAVTFVVVLVYLCFRYWMTRASCRIGRDLPAIKLFDRARD
jgi:hypothetical protein